MNQSRTVLVVDDEDQLLRLLARVVERGGMQALVAETAAEARRIFREHASDIDVVLLDVRMPGGEGAATLLPEFLAERPTLQVILTSGDELPADLDLELTLIGGQFLRKPFVPTTLLRLLESATGPGPRASAPLPAGPGGVS